MLALIPRQPALLTRTDPFEPGVVDRLFEKRVQLRLAISIAAGTRASWFALIDAHKDVPLIFFAKKQLLKNNAGGSLSS